MLPRVPVIYFCLLVDSIPLYGYIKICLSCLLSIWIVSNLGLLQIKLLWTFVYKYLGACVFISVKKYLVMEWLSYMIGAFLTFKETVKQFSKVLDWIEVNWNVFYPIILNLFWTYPARLLSWTHCWKSLAKDTKVLYSAEFKGWSSHFILLYPLAVFGSIGHLFLECFLCFLPRQLTFLCFLLSFCSFLSRLPCRIFLLFQRSKCRRILGFNACCSAIVCLCTS